MADLRPWLMLGTVFRRGISIYARLAILFAVLVNAYGIYAILGLEFVSF